jgi:hypothetical protein
MVGRSGCSNGLEIGAQQKISNLIANEVSLEGAKRNAQKGNIVNRAAGGRGGTAIEWKRFLPVCPDSIS